MASRERPAEQHSAQWQCVAMVWAEMRTSAAGQRYRVARGVMGWGMARGLP